MTDTNNNENEHPQPDRIIVQDIEDVKEGTTIIGATGDTPQGAIVSQRIVGIKGGTVIGYQG